MQRCLLCARITLNILVGYHDAYGDHNGASAQNSTGNRHHRARLASFLSCFLSALQESKRGTPVSQAGSASASSSPSSMRPSPVPVSSRGAYSSSAGQPCRTTLSNMHTHRSLTPLQPSLQQQVLHLLITRPLIQPTCPSLAYGLCCRCCISNAFNAVIIGSCTLSITSAGPIKCRASASYLLSASVLLDGLYRLYGCLHQ